MNQLDVNNDFSRQQWLETFEPENTTWLVPTLQQKLVLQQHILPKFGVLPERAFFRVNEFWQLLLKQNCPELKIVSKAWMQTRLDHWLENQTWSVARSKGAGNILLQYLQHMLPALSTPNGQELMSEWFQENPSAFIRWGHWAQLSFQAWNFITEQKMLLAEWAPAFLNQLDEIDYNYNLIIDLNYDLSPLEAEVFFKINCEKKLLVENEALIEIYKDDFLSYQLLFEKLNTELKPKALTTKAECEYQRFSSQLGELKNLCAHLKELIHSGVPAQKIAVLAPQIEDYWALMYSFFREEGLQVQKRQSLHLHSLPHIMSWFAKLHKHIERPEFFELETDFSAHIEDYSLSYSELKQQFVNIHSDQDFAQLAEKNDLKHSSLQEKQGSFTEFVEFATELYTSSDTDSLVTILSRAYLDLQPEVILPYSQWLKYLKSLTAKIEVSERKLADGIICENLEAFHPWGQDYIFVLGLTDENIKGQQSLCAINHYEVSSIGQSTGFYFKRPETKSLEIKLHQLIHQCDSAKLFLSFAEADLQGELQAPAKLWILKALEQGEDIQKIKTPKFCTWDQIQRQTPESIQNYRGIDSRPFSVQYHALLQDMGEELPIKTQNDLTEVSLSVSKMESYLKCPFIFTSEKLFSLQSLPDLDLDLDHLTTGRVMHALFEKIVQNKTFNYQVEVIEAYLNQICDEYQVVFFEQFLKNNFFSRYQNMAENFILFESQWRKDYPETQTVGTELRIKSFWNTNDKNFNLENGQAFFGSIDRVDQDPQGNYVIIDYKSSGIGQTNHSSWVKNKKLQLALYAMAIEAGATSLPKGPVVGAFYFNVKEMKRDKGFQVVDQSQSLLPEPSRYISVTTEQKQQLYNEISELFNSAVEDLKSGLIHANPEDIKECNTCDWSELCRAPHLN
ncbi:MAG: PD-(D/E)XK nuclease family protein [Bdellovibrionales bacterium]|nr:PD-(D/E)XK nuclease family protein [Bdellovibrionales bacterium]